MKGFAIFLTVVICLLVATGVTLLIVIIGLSRKIAHTQKNVSTLRQRTTEVMDAVAFVSSGVALVGGVMAKIDSIRRSDVKREASSDRRKKV